MVRVINHRPSHRPSTPGVPLLGSCVEIETSRANILCDAGVFFPAGEEFLDVLARKNDWEPGIDHPALAARHYHCLLSHGHTDHYAGLFALGPDGGADAYAGDLTWRIVVQTAKLLEDRFGRVFLHGNVEHAGTFEHAAPFLIEDCLIVPVRVSHNIPDSWAFVVECAGIRLLYAPEFMDRFWLKEPELIKDIDIAAVGYMPDVPPGRDGASFNKDIALLRRSGCLLFYVTPGENLESIEDCFREYEGLTFVSPYVACV